MLKSACSHGIAKQLLRPCSKGPRQHAAARGAADIHISRYTKMLQMAREGERGADLMLLCFYGRECLRGEGHLHHRQGLQDAPQPLEFSRVELR